MSGIEKRLASEHARARLERALEVALGGLSQDVDRDGLRVVQVLDAHEALDEERLRVLEVAVQDRHHRDAEVDAAELGGAAAVGHAAATRGGRRTSFETSERS